MANQDVGSLCPERMKVVELKHVLKSRDVRITGKKKADLIAR